MPPIILKREPKYDTKHEAFPYQEEAVKAIRDLEYAAIFHEQGLGKTKIAIDLMVYWFEKKVVDTVLLIVKKTLINNWMREFKIHAHIKPKLLTQNRKANFFVFNSPARVILAHYEIIKSEKERIKLFLKTRDVAAILDESAKIKNPESSITKVFLEIAPLLGRRVIMTGTPIANRPYDIWSQIWFLDQGKSMGDNFKEFKRNLDLSNELYRDEDEQKRFERELELISEKTTSFSVRETKAKGVLALPRKVIESIKTDWEPYQLELYEQVRDEQRALVLRNGIPSEDKADQILKRLLRLLQIASNPRLVDDSYSAKPGKLEHLIDLVTKITCQNEKCIVWTSFTKNADWLRNELQEFGSSRIHGKLTIEFRNRTIDKFLSKPESKVLVATPGAAKEGMTLTVANHVIFYDRSFGLDDYIQAQDRIHRISQTKTCYVHNLVMTGSIDEWVDILLHSKEMAAQLAQGDISLEYYNSRMSYEFGEIIRNILGIRE
jgi:SNF2 family DNA or RNA helicase